MGALNFFNALRTIALRDVLKETSDYQLRQIFRWYSKEFRTPLHEVSMLPMEDVLQHFYEAKYEEMDADQREEERKLLIESEEDRQTRLAIEDRELYDQRMFELEAEEIAKQQEIDEAKKAKREGRDAKLIVPDLPSVNLPTMMPDSLTDPLAPPPGRKLPPNISVKFVSDEEIQRLINEGDDGDEEMDINPHGNLPKASADPTPKLK